MKAKVSHVRMSSRKVGLMASIIRRKSVTEALNFLKFAPRYASNPLYKVLHSAVSNAEHNDKKDVKNLMVDQVIVNQGKTLKRGMPVSRGRWHRILKRSCHITVLLKDTTDNQ